jgi:phage shock protein E
MKIHRELFFAVCITTVLMALFAENSPAQIKIPNPQIDYAAFLQDAKRVEVIRQSHRVTEDRFLKMMSEPGIVLLDARSATKFKLRHLQGAINLSLPDFTAAELAKIIPAKNTTVLIYCNNNFTGSPVSFASKAPAASLNISTFVNLNTYGYTNVYELGPLIDVKNSKLPFEGDELAK